MNHRWQVGFIAEYVYEEFMVLPEEVRANALRIVDLIEEYGLEEIGMPYVRHLRGKLWEIRAKGGKLAGRSIYVTVAGRKIVILRSFIKKTRETPPAEIELALKRWSDNEGGIDDGFRSL